MINTGALLGLTLNAFTELIKSSTAFVLEIPVALM
jgi:hypothetical protein